jgi:acyl-CoA synthetase (AMP-forming)/AMP-acid ligase II/acyl carrier protein
MEKHPRTVIELLRDRADRHPTHGYTFFTDRQSEVETMSYADLDRRAQRIAAHLRARGVKGEPVLILSAPGLDYIAAFFGCLYAGCIATPAYPPDPMRLGRTLPRLRAILKDTGARFVLTTSPIASMLPIVASEAPELGRLEWISVDDLRDDGAWIDPSIDGSRIAFLQYTSGSTSDPKGVMLTHANLVHNLEWIRRTFEIGPETQSAFWLPPYHDMGLIGAIMGPLVGGGNGALTSPLDFLKRPMWWLELISNTRADVSGGPNFAFDLCVRKSTPEARAALDLSCLTLLMNAAEPIRPETHDAFSDAFAVSGFEKRSFFTCFGLAEGTLLATSSKRSVEARRGTFGDRPLMSAGKSPEPSAIAIVDPETSTRVADGAVGEIWLKSGSVAKGYWRNEEATKTTFGASLADGAGTYLRTGDIGFVDADDLFFVGRVKDIIKLSGVNHYPQDIESAVEKAHRALRPGCGVAFADEHDGHEALVVVWEVERAKMSDPQEVITAVRGAVAKQESVAVQTVVLIEARSIPKTSSGKLQRRQTRTELREGTLEIVASWSAPVEQAPIESSDDVFDPRAFLVSRIARSFGLEDDQVDVDLPFAEYGFDSKMAVELAAELSAQTGKSLPATLAFNYPTINALVQHLEES